MLAALRAVTRQGDPPAYVHPAAIVETDQLGSGTRVWAFTHVMAGAVVGRECNIGSHCFIESGAVIGDRTTVKNGVAVWDGVSLGEGVFVGPLVVFTNDLYPRSPRLREVRDRYECKANWLVPTFVEHGATIGAGAIVRAGVTIGAYATVGAGAVVTRDVPPRALVVGNPAQVRGSMCPCGAPLLGGRDEATCRAGHRAR